MISKKESSVKEIKKNTSIIPKFRDVNVGTFTEVPKTPPKPLPILYSNNNTRKSIDPFP